MSYGSLLLDVVQSSTAGVPPQFNDGNGTQTGTLCRAWVSYKGTATRGINASFNVSSVTVNGTGDYTFNFTTALSDANYSLVSQIIPSFSAFGSTARVSVLVSQTTTTAQIRTGSLSISQTVTAEDEPLINVAVFR